MNKKDAKIKILKSILFLSKNWKNWKIEWQFVFYDFL